MKVLISEVCYLPHRCEQLISVLILCVTWLLPQTGRQINIPLLPGESRQFSFFRTLEFICNSKMRLIHCNGIRFSLCTGRSKEMTLPPPSCLFRFTSPPPAPPVSFNIASFRSDNNTRHNSATSTRNTRDDIVGPVRDVNKGTRYTRDESMKLFSFEASAKRIRVALSLIYLELPLARTERTATWQEQFVATVSKDINQFLFFAKDRLLLFYFIYCIVHCKSAL